MNKKFFFLWILAVYLCSGCNHGSDDPSFPPTPPGPTPEPDPTPIELYTSLVSRAAIDQFKETPIGIAVGKQADEVTEIWDATASAEHISLTPIHYYPTDSSTLYVRGFYPRTSPKGVKASYSLTGKEDLLYANEQTGSLTTPFTVKDNPLTFHHLLAQLNIDLQTGSNFPEGYLLKSFHLKGSSGTTSVNLLTGELHFDGISTVFTIYSDNDGKELNPDNSLSLGSILVEPGAELTIDFILINTKEEDKEIAFNDLPVEFEGGGSGSGLSYKLNFTLPDKPDPDDPDHSQAIHLRAVLIPWVEGEEGTGGILR